MIAILAALALKGAAPPSCSYDRAAMLALPYTRFDDTLDSGWRAVGDRPGCEADAADLIAAYRRTHAFGLVEPPPEQLRSLDWHEGQLRAAAGQTAPAIALLERGAREPDEAGDSLYHQATVAFLKRDRAELLRLQARILALPKPAWFEASVVDAQRRGLTVPPWPVHAELVRGLVDCFDKSYAEAYDRACRKP